jgi:hypothetical protein
MVRAVVCERGIARDLEVEASALAQGEVLRT